MNRSMKKILVALLFAAVPLTGLAQAKPGELDAVIRQMDAASPKFHSAEADFQWDFYERVVKQTTTQHGGIYFKKNGASLEMGAKINPPGAKFFSFKGGNLMVFDPGTKDLKLFASGKNRAQYESFLTLGFGGSGSELVKAWTVTYVGTEPLSDGSTTIPTAKLDLVSKDPDVRNMFSHITIWVDTARGISLKQQFFTPSDDYRTTIYSNIRYNQPVNTKPYDIKK